MSVMVLIGPSVTTHNETSMSLSKNPMTASILPCAWNDSPHVSRERK